MTCKVLKIELSDGQVAYTKNQKFIIVYLQNVETKKVFKTYTGHQYRNFKRWIKVKEGQLLSNLTAMSDKLINADSQFKIVKSKNTLFDE